MRIFSGMQALCKNDRDARLCAVTWGGALLIEGACLYSVGLRLGRLPRLAELPGRGARGRGWTLSAKVRGLLRALMTINEPPQRRATRLVTCRRAPLVSCAITRPSECTRSPRTCCGSRLLAKSPS
jgi:hypothetical protein